MTDHQAELIGAAIFQGLKMIARSIATASLMRTVTRVGGMPEATYENVFRAIEVGITYPNIQPRSPSNE